MANYELPSVFYLGREYDLKAAQPKPDYLLYESKDLVTHAVCVGMTGSGKTGLCLHCSKKQPLMASPRSSSIPKGSRQLDADLPQLRPSDFQPWVDPGEANANNKR